MITENSIPIEQLSEKSTETRKHRTFFDVHARLWMSAFLLLTDLFCLFIAILLALLLRWLPVIKLAPAYDQIFTLLAAILVIKFYRADLYPGIGLHYIDELRKLVNSLSSTFVIVLAVTFLLQTSIIYSRLVIFIAWIIAIVLIPLGRYLVRRALIHLGLWGVPVVIIGNPEQALALAEQLHINSQNGIRPVLIIRDEHCLACSADISAAYPVFSLARIKKTTRRLHLQDVLIMIDDFNHVDQIDDRYRFIFKSVILIKNH